MISRLQMHRHPILLLFFSIIFWLPINTRAMIAKADILQDTVIARMNRQLEVYPQEKIYVHNDKPIYLKGETVWFRVYLVNASSLLADSSSLYVYGELINPIGKVVDRVKVMQQEGIYAGHFSIKDDIPDGVYTMCFYTKYMQNMGDDYFYKRNISIKDPSSISCHVEQSFVYKQRKKIEMSLRFVETHSNTPFIPQELEIGYDGEENLKSEKTNTEGVLFLTLTNTIKGLYLRYKFRDVLRTEYLSVPPFQQDYNIQILPEGGKLLSGISNQVSFKATNSDGLGEDVSVFILNEAGDTIVFTNSQHQGMGVFEFTPDKAKKYMLYSINANSILKKVDLSDRIDNGCALSLTSTNKYIRATVNTTDPHSIESLYLIVHSRGNVIYSSNVQKDKSFTSFSKEDLPTGVINFVLKDTSNNIISERLIFNRNIGSEPHVEIKMSEPLYKTRSLVKAKIYLTDMLNNKLNGNVSVSVIDNNDVKIDSTQNIVSALLLSSELGKTIEQPYSYLKDSHNARHYLNLLTLTNKWNRYNTEEILKGKMTYPTIPIEDANILSGSVKNRLLMNRKNRKADISIFTFNPFSKASYKTDDNGGFHIAGYDMPDSTIYSIKAIAKKDNEYLELILNEETFPEKREALKLPYQIKSSAVRKEINNYLAKADQKYLIENGMRHISLKEIEILGTTKKAYGESQFSAGPFGNIYTSDHIIMKTAPTLQVLLRSLGLYLLTDDFGGLTGKISLRSAPLADSLTPRSDDYGTALLLVDDVEDSGGHYILSNPLSENIKEIEIIKGSMAAYIFGDKAIGGAILITTNKNIENKVTKNNRKVFMPLGYQLKKEFYAPRYETTTEKESIKPDLRTTIHWQANLDIKGGEGELQFYTADSKTYYSILIEGLTDKGIPFSKVEKIEVKD